MLGIEDAPEDYEDQIKIDDDIMPIQNIMEKALREADINNSQYDPATMEVALSIRERNAIVEKFLSSEKLKTQVTKTERQNLPLIYLLSESPFYSTKDFYIKYKTIEEYDIIKNKFLIPELQEWATAFLELGLAENREGRKEDKDAIAAMFSQEVSLKQGGKNNEFPRV